VYAERKVLMGLSDLHLSHIRKVAVGFIISGKNLNPQEITNALGLQPDLSATRGDEQRNLKGALLAPYDAGFWRLDTKAKVQSKDINDHFRYLLSILLPHRDAILNLSQEGDIYFDVLWQSTYLYAGTGPIIDRDSLQGISQLQASMGFDIYQIDEEEEKFQA
jgi:hypothetical protein